MLRINNIEMHDIEMSDTRDFMQKCIYVKCIINAILISVATLIVIFIQTALYMTDYRITYKSIISIITTITYAVICVRFTDMIDTYLDILDQKSASFAKMKNDVSEMFEEDVQMLKQYENNNSIIILSEEDNDIIFLGTKMDLKREILQTITIDANEFTSEMMLNEDIINVNLVQQSGLYEFIFSIVPVDIN